MFILHCPALKTLQSHTCNFVEKIENSFVLLWKNVLFGFTDLKTQKQNLLAYHVINLIMTLAKFHIHRCKFTNRPRLQQPSYHQGQVSGPLTSLLLHFGLGLYYWITSLCQKITTYLFSYLRLTYFIAVSTTQAQLRL